MRARVLFVALGGFVAAACGLSVTGRLDTSAGDAGPVPGADGAALVDGGIPTGEDAASDAPVVPCDSGLATGAVLVPAAGGACPPGTTEKIVQTDPQAVGGACACGACTVTQEATCAGASFVWTWGGSSSCSNGPASYNVTADNACIEIFGSNTTLAAYNHWNRQPTGGTCAAAGVPADGGVTSTPVRQCVPNPSACPVVASGDRICVPADPDGGACSGTFSAAVVVGDEATLDCAPCACTRTGQCHVEYHGNSTCTDKRYERNADGTCITTGTPSIQRIKVYPTSMVCNSVPGAATAGLANQRTLCCTP